VPRRKIAMLVSAVAIYRVGRAHALRFHCDTMILAATRAQRLGGQGEAGGVERSNPACYPAAEVKGG